MKIFTVSYTRLKHFINIQNMHSCKFQFRFKSTLSVSSPIKKVDKLVKYQTICKSFFPPATKQLKCTINMYTSLILFQISLEFPFHQMVILTSDLYHHYMFHLFELIFKMYFIKCS